MKKVLIAVSILALATPALAALKFERLDETRFVVTHSVESVGSASGTSAR